MAAAGCGGAEPPPPPQPIPAENAARLEDLLQEADRQFRNGDCDELEGTLERVSQGVDEIPNAEIDQRLLASLDTGTDRLAELAERCEPREVTVTETTPPPAPVPTQTVPTTPVPTPDTSTEQTDNKQDQPDKEESEPSKPEQKDQQDPDQGSKPDPKPPKEDPCEGGDPRC